MIIDYILWFVWTYVSFSGGSFFFTKLQIQVQKGVCWTFLFNFLSSPSLPIIYLQKMWLVNNSHIKLSRKCYSTSLFSFFYFIF